MGEKKKCPGCGTEVSKDIWDNHKECPQCGLIVNPAGARVQHETGSIEPGKRADLTVVDFYKPHLTPSFDIAAELTRYTYGSDVETVVIDGRIVMEDRIVKTLDEREILSKAMEIGERVY